MNKSQIGLIGLGTMGENLARNFANKDVSISVYNRTTSKTDEFLAQFGNDKISGFHSLEEFVANLSTPRKIILMVSAGPAVDAVISELKPLLEKGDIIIDAGNSNYRDTEKREEALSASGLDFIGMGISGGEEGALHGPSMMPGGNEEAYKKVEPILQLAAANDNKNGKCIAYVGPKGAGHFVKTVHNGIEYAIMQAIAESYDILHKIGKISNDEISEIFNTWNQGEYLNSFLLEISSKILKYKEDNQNLIDLIKDKGKQKGTGKWTSEASFDYGMSTPSITSAVDARMMSGHPTRGKIAFPESLNETEIPNKEKLTEISKNALELTIMLSYFQGFDLIATASKENNYNISLPETARIWSNGCIIRSSLLPLFEKLYSDKPVAEKTQLLNQFAGEKQVNWRKFISLGINNGIPLPTTQSSLFYYDTLRAEKLPQNLIQAQRDFFGAHSYERTDKDGNFHTNWN